MSDQSKPFLTLQSLQLEFTGTDNPQFECSLDSTPFSVCTSPVTYNSLQTGFHTFKVRAVNSIGNADPTPATFEWKVLKQSNVGSGESVNHNCGQNLIDSAAGLTTCADITVGLLPGG